MGLSPSFASYKLHDTEHIFLLSFKSQFSPALLKQSGMIQQLPHNAVVGTE